MIGQLLKLPIVILLANIHLVAANLDQIHDHSVASADFQAVNTYLTQTDGLDLEQTRVVTNLLDAIETIESVGVDTLSSLSGLDNVLDVKFKPLLDGNLAVVVNILKNLVTASDCDEESENFLHLTRKETFVGQFLNQYAQMMLNVCLKKHLINSAKSFEKTASKVAAATYELLEELAIRLAKDKELKKLKSHGQLTINEPPLPNLSSVETLKVIKKLSFDNDLRGIAIELNRIFNKRLFTDDNGEIIKLDRSIQLDKMDKFYQDYLVSPCQSVATRLETTLGPFANYRTKKFVVSPELEAMQKVDATLDYLLEMSRICLEVEAHKSLIWNMLKSMR